MKSHLLSLSLFVSIFSVAQFAEARPEYAVRHAIVSCTACHVSPVGGGIKNLSGKLYAANSKGYQFTPKKYQENLSFDMRILFYESEKYTGTRGGLGLMNATIGGVLPLEEGEDFNISAVAETDLGAFPGAGPRSVYAITNFGDNQLVENVMVGKFVVPFGLLTDEHRTYTRIQSLTSFNDFEMGALLSGRLGFESMHYDLGAFSGMHAGGNLVSGSANGGVVNVRWAPRFLPFYFGVSANYYNIDQKPDPNADTAYVAVSLDRLTNSLIKGSFLLESARARYFNTTDSNSQVPTYFIGSDSAYQAAVDGSTSEGLYALLNIDVSPRTTLIYKYDSISLDHSYDGDAFERHGFGVKRSLTRQTSVSARYEYAQVGREGVSDSLRSAQNAFWALYQAWF